MSKAHYLLLLIVVLVLAFFTRWLLTSVEEPTRRGVPAARHDPDYFLDKFTATIYEQNGQPYYRLNAEYLEHFPDDNTMALKQLHLDYLQDPVRPWTASADAGTAYENLKTVSLYDNVLIRRSGPEPADRLSIKTDKLHFDFVRRLASTDSKVNITSKNSNIVATGMRIDLQAGTMSLLSEVKGRYEPD